MKKVFAILNLLMFPVFSYAWDQTGHQIIALIAYDNLSTNTKIEMNYYLGSHRRDVSNYRLLSAAIWPDQIKEENVTAFNDWHFIDIPFSIDKSPLPTITTDNVVWAIQESEQVLNSSTSSKSLKNMFLKFLIHFVGDAHQPLHCATEVTQEYPQGDEGGNLFHIQSAISNNLHGFWDEGVGYFSANYSNYPLKYWQIRQVANTIESKYPITYFGAKAADVNPSDWANESFNLAKNNAYKNITPNTAPSNTYIMANQMLVQQQIALAGYRLANVLNQIFEHNSIQQQY